MHAFMPQISTDLLSELSTQVFNEYSSFVSIFTFGYKKDPRHHNLHKFYAPPFDFVLITTPLQGLAINFMFKMSVLSVG